MRSPTLAAVLCMASSPASTVRIPVFGAYCAVDILLGRKFRQASLELVSYTYDSPFSSREENCDIVCCCVRDSIALFKPPATKLDFG